MYFNTAITVSYRFMEGQHVLAGKQYAVFYPFLNIPRAAASTSELGFFPLLLGEHILYNKSTSTE